MLQLLRLIGFTLSIVGLGYSRDSMVAANSELLGVCKSRGGKLDICKDLK